MTDISQGREMTPEGELKNEASVHAYSPAGAPPTKPRTTEPKDLITMTALYSFTSHIQGRNARVEIHPDRIEWTRSKSSAGKMLGAVATLGASALVTGLHNKSTESIPLKLVSSLTLQQHTTHTVLVVASVTGAVELRMGHKDADKARAIILQAMGAL